jgi:hypothetical protein
MYGLAVVGVVVAYNLIILLYAASQAKLNVRLYIIKTYAPWLAQYTPDLVRWFLT